MTLRNNHAFNLLLCSWLMIISYDHREKSLQNSYIILIRLHHVVIFQHWDFIRSFLSSFHWSLDAMCDWEEWFQSLIIKWIQIFSYTGISVSLLTVQHAARGRLAFKQKTFSNPFLKSVWPSRCVLYITKYFQNKTASSRLNSFFLGNSESDNHKQCPDSELHSCKSKTK